MRIDRAGQASIRSLITLAILANTAAGWPDPLPVPLQPSPAPAAGQLIRAEANKYACSVNSTEAAEGHRLMQAGHFAEAQAKLQTALGAAEAGDGSDPIHRACLLNSVGIAELQQRHLDLAVQWFERGLELKPLSDALAALLTSNLASAYSNLNRLERAEELARQAIHLSVRAFGPDEPEVLYPQTTLAFIQVARGEYASAEPVLRRVLYQAERTWSATSYEVAVAAANLAFVHFAQGQYAVARELFQKSVSGLVNNSVRAKDVLPLTQAALAVLCAAEARSQEANMWLERALTSATQELSTEDPALAVVLERAAIARFFLNDDDSGRQLFDRAITILEARYGPRSQPVQEALERYSGLLRKVRDTTRSGQLNAQRKELDARLKGFASKR